LLTAAPQLKKGKTIMLDLFGWWRRLTSPSPTPQPPTPQPQQEPPADPERARRIAYFTNMLKEIRATNAQSRASNETDKANRARLRELVSTAPGVEAGSEHQICQQLIDEAETERTVARLEEQLASARQRLAQQAKLNDFGEQRDALLQAARDTLDSTDKADMDWLTGQMRQLNVKMSLPPSSPKQDDAELQALHEQLREQAPETTNMFQYWRPRPSW
jgi:hypothetical protein